MKGIKTVLSEINETKQRIGFTRYDRIEKYIKNVEKNFKLESKVDIEIAAEIRELIDYRIKKVKFLFFLNMLFFIGIYFSFFSIFLPGFFKTSEVGTLLTKIIGLFGTTLFIIGIFISNRIQELYYQDLNLLTAHLISLYTKTEKKGKLVDKARNKYHEFVQFFKQKKK